MNTVCIIDAISVCVSVAFIIMIAAFFSIQIKEKSHEKILSEIEEWKDFKNLQMEQKVSLSFIFLGVFAIELNEEVSLVFSFYQFLYS